MVTRGHGARGCAGYRAPGGGKWSHAAWDPGIRAGGGRERPRVGAVRWVCIGAEGLEASDNEGGGMCVEGGPRAGVSRDSARTYDGMEDEELGHAGDGGADHARGNVSPFLLLTHVLGAGCEWADTVVGSDLFYFC